MLCDKITYGGQTLLTLYHQDFDQKRSHKRIEKIGRYNLIFEENAVSNCEASSISGWYKKDEGLLAKGAAMNPYGLGTCAYVEHYRYIHKPSRLFHNSESMYALSVSPKDLIQINEFVEKYTGFPISRNPMYYGDVFAFRCQFRRHYAKEDKGIVIAHLPADAMAVVRFLRSNMVVSTKIIHTDCDQREVEILSDEPWESHDIEIYVHDDLIYCDRDVSYMRHMQLALRMNEPAKKVKLRKIAQNYALKNDGASQIINIGGSADEIEEMFRCSTAKILKSINELFTDPKVTFIEPGESGKAIKIIGDVMEQATDSIWIFDSYFTDKSALKGMLDWLRILANCKAKSKNIVFFCKDSNHAFDAATLAHELRKDSELSMILRNKKTLGFHFYQTKAPIHDRFVLIDSEQMLAGVAIGTSFNSLGKNHYCIFRLNNSVSRAIWQGLHDWMNSHGNLVGMTEV